MFGGQIQQANAWMSMCEEVLNGVSSYTNTATNGSNESVPASRSGLDVYVLQLPGRFESINLPCYTDFAVLVADICTHILGQGWFSANEAGSENGCENLPLYMLGYSFGCCLAYECSLQLLAMSASIAESRRGNTDNMLKCLHLISGPHR